jgi:hypothetical protein
MNSADVPCAATPTDARGARLARGLRADLRSVRAIVSNSGPDRPARLTASPGGVVHHPILPSPGAVTRTDR